MVFALNLKILNNLWELFFYSLQEGVLLKLDENQHKKEDKVGIINAK